MFDTYRRLTKGRKDAVYGALDEAYQTLMTDGVKPLFALLAKGDMAGYHDLLSTTTSIQDDYFYQALGAVHAHQKQLVNQAEADEQLYYRRVVHLAVWAMGTSWRTQLLASVLMG